MTVVAQSPLPYLPIKILDVAEHRSSVRRPTAPRGRGRRIGAAAMAVLALAAIAAANVGSAPVRTDPLGEFRLAPGHAVPIALARPIEGNAPTDFRLGPGHAMPAGLSR